VAASCVLADPADRHAQVLGEIDGSEKVVAHVRRPVPKARTEAYMHRWTKSTGGPRMA
jgi:hypothetical protein